MTNENKLIAIMCVLMWLFTWGGVFAAMDSSNGMSRVHTCRENMSFSLLISAIPPTWILAPFMTGFYEDGFKFYCQDEKR